MKTQPFGRSTYQVRAWVTAEQYSYLQSKFPDDEPEVAVAKLIAAAMKQDSRGARTASSPSTFTHPGQYSTSATARPGDAPKVVELIPRGLASSSAEPPVADAKSAIWRAGLSDGEKILRKRLVVSGDTIAPPVGPVRQPAKATGGKVSAKSVGKGNGKVVAPDSVADGVPSHARPSRGKLDCSNPISQLNVLHQRRQIPSVEYAESMIDGGQWKVVASCDGHSGSAKGGTIKSAKRLAAIALLERLGWTR